MCEDVKNGQSIRSVNCRMHVEDLRATPKPDSPLPSLPQRRGMRPLLPPKQSKPLPPIPRYKHIDFLGQGPLQSKTLPRSPSNLNLTTTLLWVAGFCLWFLLIVVLLPVIMEKDAMPGFNRWLRKWWWSARDGTKARCKKIESRIIGTHSAHTCTKIRAKCKMKLVIQENYNGYRIRVPVNEYISPT